MAIAAGLKIDDQVKHSREEIYEWLYKQAPLLDIEIVLYPEEASMEGHYLYLPTYLPDGRDAYDYAVKLQKLEDAWNDQVPRPNPPINLIPAKSPEQRAVLERLWEARDRKNEAADAAAEAETETEQESTLVQLRVARQEEVQAEKDYEAFYQLKSVS